MNSAAEQLSLARESLERETAALFSSEIPMLTVTTDFDADLKPLYNSGAREAASTIQLLRDLGVTVAAVPVLTAIDDDLKKAIPVIGAAEVTMLQLHRAIKKIAPPTAASSATPTSSVVSS